MEIAKAANAQKPIKDADLKANAPEQRSFAQAMRAVGVFYQTKRGEKIDNQFADSYLHTCKELLYIDYYFKEKFLSKFERRWLTLKKEIQKTFAEV